jgi:hypothetical protein
MGSEPARTFNKAISSCSPGMGVDQNCETGENSCMFLGAKTIRRKNRPCPMKRLRDGRTSLKTLIFKLLQRGPSCKGAAHCATVF